MNTSEALIQAPPSGSLILSERRNESYVISGKSEGVPLRLFSPKALGVMEKALRLKEKLGSKPSGGSVADLLAQQEFDWSIEVFEDRVVFSSSALPDDSLFTLRDVRRVFQTPEGCLAAELAHMDGDQNKVQILTGNLAAEDMAWLNGALIELLSLDQGGVAKPRPQIDLNSTPPESFKIVAKTGGSRAEIQHRTKLLHRIFPLVIGAIVLLLAGSALLGGGGDADGILPGLEKMVGDHPGWSQVLRYLIIGGFIYTTCRILKIVLGTLKMEVDQHSFRMKDGILGVGITRKMPRSQMIALEQSTWTVSQSDSDGHRTYTQYWRLELKGEKSMTLLTDETSPEDTDWLGQFLSDWFEIPFVKKR